MIRPQPLIAPRPNTRKHPLDSFEMEMVSDPLDAPSTNWSSLLISGGLVLLVVAVAGWGIWRVGRWVFQ